jgi:hypothetical protein
MLALRQTFARDGRTPPRSPLTLSRRMRLADFQPLPPLLLPLGGLPAADQL